MKVLSTLLIFTCFISFFLMIIGFFSPSISLFWLRKTRTRLKSFAIYSLLTIVATLATFYINIVGLPFTNEQNLSEIDKIAKERADKVQVGDLLRQPNKYLTLKEFVEATVFWEDETVERKKRIKSLMTLLEGKKFEIDANVMQNGHLGFGRYKFKSANSTTDYKERFIFGDNNEMFSVDYMTHDSTYFRQLKVALIGVFDLTKSTKSDAFLRKLGMKVLEAENYINTKDETEFTTFIINNNTEIEYHITKNNYGVLGN